MKAGCQEMEVHRSEFCPMCPCEACSSRRGSRAEDSLSNGGPSPEDSLSQREPSPEDSSSHRGPRHPPEPHS